MAGGEMLGPEWTQLRRLGWEQRACALAGRNLTHAEWAQFVGGPGYARVCP